MRVNRFISKW